MLCRPGLLKSSVNHGGVRCKEKRGDWAALLNSSGRPDVSGEMINTNTVNTAVYPVEEESGWAFRNARLPEGLLQVCARHDVEGRGHVQADLYTPRQWSRSKAGSLSMNIATVLCPKGLSLMAVVEDPPEGFLGGPAAYICKLWRCKHIGFEIMLDFTEQHGNGGLP